MTHLKTFRDSPTNSPNTTRRASSALPRRRGDVGRSLAAPPPLPSLVHSQQRPGPLDLTAIRLGGSLNRQAA